MECVLTRTRSASGFVGLLAACAASAVQAQVVPPVGPPPAFGLTAAVNASESYVSNASGLAAGSQSDFISTIGFSAGMHDHTRRVTFDLNYALDADFYARDSQRTQITNHLFALGIVEAIPDYLTIKATAFATPVLLSNAGIVTAGNRVVANGYSNSFGYTIGPELRFRLGDFASSNTVATYGSTFFANPNGSTPGVIIPGVAGAEDTNYRSAAQSISSGQYFGRFNWSATGQFNETKRKQGLLSQKSGTGRLAYAFNHEFTVLGSLGYQAVTASVPLTGKISGLTVYGGFSWTQGDRFSLTAEAGRSFNQPSYIGSLRYNLTPRTTIVGSLTDVVTTPEAQLLNGQTSPPPPPPNGTPAPPPGGPNPQSPGSPFNQNISRYQTLNLSFQENMERNQAALNFYATRQTILSGIFLGPATTESWGGQITYSRNLSPRMTGTAGGSYDITQELGGEARTFRVNGQISYNLSPRMNAFLETDYVDRHSSASLTAVSPQLTGSLNDYRIMVGISRVLLP
jgi:hypothetical protein